MSQEERLMILQMVADKKISATEAAELLRALDGSAPTERPRPGGETDPRERVAEIKRPPRPPEPPRGPEFPRAPEPPVLSGLGGFIENIVERVGSVFSDVVEPRYEFPEELTGEWAADQVPVRVMTGNGRVEIKGWDQPGYKATITVKANGATEEEARTRAKDAYTVSADENRFELDARRGDNTWNNIAVHLTLMVPKGKRYLVEARTGNGKVELDQLLTVESRVNTGNGRIRLIGGAHDRVHVKTGNGSVEVAADVGDLEASTGNGSVTVTPAGNRDQNLRLSTGNGSLEIETSQLPSGFGLKLDAHTGMGTVNIGLPNLIYDRDVRSMAHKHVIARTPDLEAAPMRLTVAARTGMGSVNIH